MKTERQKTNFWKQIKRPIFALAPMIDVTDSAFRCLIARYGKPDVMFTEFVSCDGLCSPGRERLMKYLRYHESERPIVAQLFGKNPKTFAETAKFVGQLGFDGIDINMGCPDRNVCKQGAGASLIKTPELASEIIRVTKEAAGEIPVSVKTRMGYNRNVLGQWIEQLLETEPAAISIHLRTAKEMSKVDAHWDQISYAVDAARGTGIPILGNGDLLSLAQADDLVEKTGVDGIMFGRAIFGNPWLFDRSREQAGISLDERLDVMIEHARLFESYFSESRNFLVMRKHLRAYANGFDGAKELRMRLENINHANDAKQAIESFRSDYKETAERPQV